MDWTPVLGRSPSRGNDEEDLFNFETSPTPNLGSRGGAVDASGGGFGQQNTSLSGAPAAANPAFGTPAATGGLFGATTPGNFDDS